MVLAALLASAGATPTWERCAEQVRDLDRADVFDEPLPFTLPVGRWPAESPERPWEERVVVAGEPLPELPVGHLLLAVDPALSGEQTLQLLRELAAARTTVHFVVAARETHRPDGHYLEPSTTARFRRCARELVESERCPTVSDWLDAMRNRKCSLYAPLLRVDRPAEAPLGLEGPFRVETGRLPDEGASPFGELWNSGRLVGWLTEAPAPWVPLEADQRYDPARPLELPFRANTWLKVRPPSYPEGVDAGRQVCRVGALIGKGGRVNAVELVEACPPAFADLALEAARKARFEKPEGDPGLYRTTLAIGFSP